ncbi:hypothetical protein CVT24_012810, partial [Panaeolus cyanescens]
MDSGEGVALLSTTTRKRKNPAVTVAQSSSKKNPTQYRRRVEVHRTGKPPKIVTEDRPFTANLKNPSPSDKKLGSTSATDLFPSATSDTGHLADGVEPTPATDVRDVHQDFQDNYDCNHVNVEHPPKETNTQQAGGTKSKTSKTQDDYLREFVLKIDEILPALLSREWLDEDQRTCRQCNRHQKAIWRCRDCSFGELLCRGCMRRTHVINPLHKIECWMGTHFRPAALWEVGGYFVVKHSQKTTASACSFLGGKLQQVEEEHQEMAPVSEVYL